MINLHDSSAGLFDVFGRVFQALATMHAGELAADQDLTDILTQYENCPDDVTLNAIVAEVDTARANFSASAAALTLRTLCQQYLTEVVRQDTSPVTSTALAALQTLIAQMTESEDTLDASTVSYTLSRSTTGDGVLVVSTKRGDGRINEFILAESITIEATDDSGLTLFAEGDESVDLLSAAWPQGSGVGTSLVVTTDSGLLLNGDFETLSSDDATMPDSWLVTVGTPGTHLYVTTPEAQSVTISGTPTGGYYLLSLVGADGKKQTTSVIAYSSSASLVQSALRQLKGLENVVVTATGTAPNLRHLVQFVGAGGSQNLLTAINRMTGATSTNEVQTVELLYTDGGTATISWSGQTTAALSWNATNTQIRDAMVLTSNIDPGEVSVTGGPWPATVTINFLAGLGGTNQPEITVNAGSLTRTAPDIEIEITRPAVPDSDGSGATIDEETPGSGGDAELLGYWAMDEASGTRADSYGSADLVEVGGALSSEAGVIDDAVELVASRYLETSSNALATADVDFTVSAWVYLGSLTDYLFIALGGGTSTAWSLTYGNVTNRFSFRVVATSSSGYTVNSDTFGDPSINTWYLVVASFDATTKELTISVNAGTADTATLTGTPRGVSTGGILRVGHAVSSTGASRIDELARWVGVLDAGQIDDLYNGGTAVPASTLSGSQEVQRLTIADPFSVGGYTLTHAGNSTDPILYSDTESIIQTRLRAVSGLEAVVVSLVSSGVFDITFPLSMGNVALLTIDGTPGVDQQTTFTITGSPISGDWTTTVDGTGTETGPIPFDATAIEFESALDATGEGEFTVTGPIGGPYVVTSSGDLAATDVTFTADATDLENAQPEARVATTIEGSTDTGSIVIAREVTGTPQVYAGGYSLILESDGATLTSFTQQLTSLTAATQYALNAVLCVAEVTANGVITFDLVDGVDGTVIQDDQGTANSLAINVDDLTTSFASIASLITLPAFRLPTLMPALVYLRIRFSTAPDDGVLVFLDNVSLTQMTELYPGGPSFSVFGGADPFRIGDSFEVVTSNNRAGAVHEWMHRVFDLGSNRLLLPTATDGSETIPDSVIQ